MALALSFVKTATEEEIRQLILRFSHTAEYALTEVDIATHDMARLWGEINLAKPHKPDLRHIKGGCVLTGAQILAAIKDRKAEGQKKKKKGG